MKVLKKIGKKPFVLMAAIMFCQSAIYAQNAGAAGVGAITGAANVFKQYLGPVQNLLYAISAIIAIIGGFSIFNKMQNGDQDVKKSILMVVGGCVAFLALSTALPAFFK